MIKDRQEIERFCKELDLTSYQFDDNGGLSFSTDLNISNNELEILPFIINRVNGTLDVSYNCLETLDGCPVFTGDFNCNDNFLTNLDGGPVRTWSYNCARNNLTTLENGPEEVLGDFDCSGNNLTSLKGIPPFIEGYFIANHNNLIHPYDCRFILFSTITGKIYLDDKKIENIINSFLQLTIDEKKLEIFNILGILKEA